jgi:hypothetical protein
MIHGLDGALCASIRYDHDLVLVIEKKVLLRGGLKNVGEIELVEPTPTECAARPCSASRDRGLHHECVMSSTSSWHVVPLQRPTAEVAAPREKATPREKASVLYEDTKRLIYFRRAIQEQVGGPDHEADVRYRKSSMWEPSRTRRSVSATGLS